MAQGDIKVKVKLEKCKYCGNYPHMLTVRNSHKYMCCFDNPYGKMGNWHTTQNGARRAWNKRNNGEYA